MHELCLPRAYFILEGTVTLKQFELEAAKLQYWRPKEYWEWINDAKEAFMVELLGYFSLKGSIERKVTCAPNLTSLNSSSAAT